MNNVSSSNSQKVHVPELRFHEFREDLQQSKLSDISVYKTKRATDVKSHYISTENLLQNCMGIVPYTDETAIDGISFSINDILLGNIRPYLKKAWLAEFDGVCSTDVLVLHPLKIEPLYFKYLICRDKFFTYVMSSAKGSKMPRGDKAFIMDMTISLPSINEQKKLASMLMLIDTLISKQEKLVDEIKLYKRGVENLYFSKKYNNHCRLKDILIERNENSVKNNEHDVISSTKNGLFKQCDYFNKQASSEDTTGYKIIRLEQIVFSPQNLWMGNINYNDSYDIGIVSPSYKIFDINDGFDKYYIACLLKSSQAIKEYILASEQGASIVRRNLNMELFLQVAFFMPDLEEQIKISKHLKLLSNQLDNQEHTLKALLTMKQGLLQKMFI